LFIGHGWAGAADPAAPVPGRDQIERRLISVGTLIESSSGARQIEESGNAAAQVRRLRARELHAQATAALRSGDLAQASQLLDEAAQTMFNGVRAASAEKVTGPKDRSDFDARMESTRALLEAQKRIAAEKGGGPGAADLARRIEALMNEAARLAAAGKVDEGRVVLDQAYLAAKAAIGGMRGGDTLVRSLNFASKDEEYRYEIDRNDTHQMLVKVLLEEKRGAAGVDAMVERSTSAAAQLRKTAEEQAAKREFETAVKTLEESTRELVRAIRAAGVYIPG
jgi:hypothetical protein